MSSRRCPRSRLVLLGQVLLGVALPGATHAQDAGSAAWKPGSEVPTAPGMTSMMREAAERVSGKDKPRSRKTGPRTFEDLLSGSEPVPDLATLVASSLPPACAAGASSAGCGSATRRGPPSSPPKTFRMTLSDSAAVDVSDFNLRLMGETVSVKGCLACGEPVTLPGSNVKWYVTMRKPKAQAMTVVEGLPAIVSRTMKFDGIPAALEWLDQTAPLLRAEIIFRADPTPWAVGGRDGIAFKLVGARVYDLCTGNVIVSTPPSTGRREDTVFQIQACRDAEARLAAARTEDAAEPQRPALVLTRAQIDKAMKTVRPGVRACFAKYRFPGTLLVRYVVKDGLVETVRLRGTLRGTPTADCALPVLRSVAFAPIRASGAFAYPFVLR